jgi:triosephosphate isomerase
MQRGFGAKLLETFRMIHRPHPLVAGNWKMNGLRESLGEVSSICAALAEGDAGEAEVLICPPATLLIAANPISHQLASRGAAVRARRGISARKI